jgi:hypothetical protein
MDTKKINPFILDNSSIFRNLVSYMDWHEIFSPKEGVKALFWDVLVIGGSLEAVRRLSKWFKAKPEEWRKQKTSQLGISFGYVFGLVIIAYFSSLMIYQICSQISGQVSSSLTQKFDAYETPKIRAEIDGSTFGIADSNPRMHPITFRVKIYNSGAPTIIRDWNLKVIGADQKPIQTLFLDEQQPYPYNSTGVLTITIEKKDSIVEKTRTTPIDRNGMQEGYIIFYVQDLSREFLLAGGTSYELSFKDVNGQLYTAPDFTWPLPPR